MDIIEQNQTALWDTLAQQANGLTDAEAAFKQREASKPRDTYHRNFDFGPGPGWLRHSFYPTISPICLT